MMSKLFAESVVELHALLHPSLLPHTIVVLDLMYAVQLTPVPIELIALY